MALSTVRKQESLPIPKLTQKESSERRGNWRIKYTEIREKAIGG
jgi:hypothetical protein